MSFRMSCRPIAYAVLTVVFVVAFLLPRGDRVIFTPAEEASVGYHFSLLGWELRNALTKWVNRTSNFFRGVPESDGKELINRYQRLTREIRDLEAQLEKAAGRAGPGAPAAEGITGLEDRIDGLRRERTSLRPRLEEYLESEISRTIEQEGLGALGPLVWPPVDFRMDRPPKILVTSPRDRIERLNDVLLGPDIQVSDSERIEEQLQGGQGLAALVENLGGLSTYPNIVPADYDLIAVLEVAAHEWIHSYLFFRPLGQRFDANADMQTLNETLASLAGEEIGWATWSRLTGQPAPVPHLLRDQLDDRTPEGFSFNAFMRETRARVDELLGAGETEEAERYMESRRVELQQHGIFLRKLNQAYFAFHGTYADSPASASPIGPQVADYRKLSSSIGQVVRELAGAGSYEEFLQKLAAKRSAAS
jgi:hypothetical protein